VITSDKDRGFTTDIFRCIEAETGRDRWVLKYPAAGEMDFTNSPRANPVMNDGLVYLLGAFGQLHCVELDTGRIVWKRNIAKDFKAEPPAWGYCSTPLVLEDKLIVNPGAKDASIVALDLYTGRIIWQSPGEPAAYSSFIVGGFGGVRQIVGYDSVSVGGWDPVTGKRLWRLLPKHELDFNVPTPINLGGMLLLSTENNGTRLYGFDRGGVIKQHPIASTMDLAPDASTPVVTSGAVFGCFEGLFCLDLEDGLKTRYRVDEPAYQDYVALIAGNGRVLAITVEAELTCWRQTAAATWSYPACVFSMTRPSYGPIRHCCQADCTSAASLKSPACCCNSRLGAAARACPSTGFPADAGISTGWDGSFQQRGPVEMGTGQGETRPQNCGFSRLLFRRKLVDRDPQAR